MKIQKFEYDGRGMKRVFENEKWMVGIKNWKPENDVSGIDCLERHNQTDELFVLLSGSCVLLYANETDEGLVIEAEKMQPMRVYNIPRTLWHNTVTTEDVKLILVEDSSTGAENSDILKLSKPLIERIQKLVEL
ncbi:MAG: cupin [Oscillospiraceae bacterium]|nr:cupin [Oscillospiraceae bacterium]MDD4414039.1 cupin [Oscillospiraceae bacterium]